MKRRSHSQGSITVSKHLFALLAILAVPAAGLLCSPAMAADSAVSVDHGTTITVQAGREIDTIVASAMMRESIAGISLTVMQNGKLHYQKGYGLADTATSAPVTTETLFHLGSIAKIFTATAAMQLAEQGKLDLDAPVQKYHNFPVKQWPITSRRLLGHLSGIRNSRAEEFPGTTHTQIRAVLESFQGDALIAEPGMAFQYSNYGFVLLGLIVEKASAQSLLSYLESHLFAPSGMRHIRPDYEWNKQKHMAKGYVLRPNPNSRVISREEVAPYYSYPGASGLLGTSEDLTMFANALLTDKLVTSATRNLMWSSQHTTSGLQTPYGLGWFVRRDANGASVWHGGFVPGFYTVLYIVPEQKLAISILSNASNAKIPDLAIHLATEHLKRN